MRADGRVLVIGSPALGRAVARALPRCQSVATEALLGGLWTAGHREFDAVIVALGAGRNVLRAVRGLRTVAPRTRILVTCAAADEPRAREALRAGADDYLIEPVASEDLAGALEVAVPAPLPAAPPALPPAHEILELSQVLRNIGEGLPATLERLAALLRRAFGAEHVALQVDEHAAVAGRPGPAVLQEPLRRGDEVIGAIALGRRPDGAYTTGDAAHVAEYARLIETILAQTREQARWRELAWKDDLSGLRNRRYFDGRLDELLAQAVADRLRLTVVLFDIDEFKSYNDRYGHATGDALIREVGMLLTRCSREHDVVARYGGDEFAVILWDAEQPRVPGSQHPADPSAVAARFEAVIRNHAFQCLGAQAPGPVTLSGGLACFPWDGKTRAEILRAADEALLKAKREGKNRVVLADQHSAPAHDSPAETEDPR